MYRYQADLIDQCDESRLTIPPLGIALPPQGTCPNLLQSQSVIRRCQSRLYPEVTRLSGPVNHHGTGLVCGSCRANNHFNSRIPASSITQHSKWRESIAWAHVPVCCICDRRERRAAGDNGHDGCVCYDRLYKERWLCRECDLLNKSLLSRRSEIFRRDVRSLGILGSRMRRNRHPPAGANKLPFCPCHRSRRALADTGDVEFSNTGHPFVGNHHLLTRSRTQARNRSRPQPLASTKQVRVP